MIGGVPIAPNLAPSPGFETEEEWQLSNFTTPTSIRYYYYAGSTRIAMHEGSGTGTAGLTWLLDDHLGSTSTIVDATTLQVTQMRYKPWGETRLGSAPGSARSQTLASITMGRAGTTLILTGSCRLTVLYQIHITP